MTNHTEKLPLHTDIPVENTHYYMFSDGVDAQVRPLPNTVQRVAYPAMLTWLEAERQVFKRHDTEPSQELQECFAAAKQFVEQLTGYDLSETCLYRTPETDTEHAFYQCAIDNNIRVCLNEDAPEYQAITPAARRAFFTASLVHELGHASGIKNNSTLSIVTDGNMYTEVTCGLHSLDMRTPIVQTYIAAGGVADLRTNHFFEEAFAEELASRWREANIPIAAEHGTEIYDLDEVNEQSNAADADPLMPYRFYSICEIDGEPELVSCFTAGAAYPAAGMYAISNYTGVNLFQLMLDSKEPSQQTAARRKIIQTIEGVQKGLYPKLRDTIYSDVSFGNAYVMVLEAIESKKRQSTKLGSSVLSSVQQA